MPIGNYFTARPFDDPSARTLEGDIANVIDAGAGLTAKARPFLKTSFKTSADNSKRCSALQ